MVRLSFCSFFFCLRKTPKENHVIVGVTKAHVDRTPRLLCGPFNNSSAERQHPLIFSFNVVYGKNQADILVLIVLDRAVVVDCQRSAFGDQKLMRLVVAVVFDPQKLLIKGRKSAYIVCQQANFADLHKAPQLHQHRRAGVFRGVRFPAGQQLAVGVAGFDEIRPIG